MSRVALLLTVFAGLSAWAGAQGPAPALTAADHLRLLRANRVLLADLVHTGVKLAAADQPVDRAASCQETARALGVALSMAAEGQDADRVAELGDHLELVVRDGLVPVLDDAAKTIPAESPDAARLKAIRAGAAGDLAQARAAVPPAGTVGGDARVRAVCGKLDELRERLK